MKNLAALSVAILLLVPGHAAIAQSRSPMPIDLANSAEAVKQWMYRPTLLYGEPVEVVTQIDVNFTLSQ